MTTSSRWTRPRSDKAYARYQEKRRRFWDSHATPHDTKPADFYHQRLQRIYRFLIPPGASVIELGSGDGDLLAALEPERGVGVDFSDANVELARGRHPGLEFVNADVHELDLDEKFDFVVISDLANDVWDIQAMLERVSSLCNPRTRVILNFFNKAWQLPIGVGRATGLAQRMLKQNWLSVSDMENLLRVTGFEVISTSGEILFPFRVPLVHS
ncbi:MAG: class I SAM-dependent methyltransferase, partial [Acidimicrobiia bacterium]